jgi:plastocyanin
MSPITEKPPVNHNGSSFPRAEQGDPVGPQAAGAGESREKTRQEWAMIAVGLCAVLSLLAIVLSLVAIGSNNGNTTPVVIRAASAATGGTAAAAPVTPVLAPVSMAIAIKTDVEHGKLGPGGTWHDAFVPADFTVKPGQKVTITFSNYDDAAHTFTSPSMGVQETIPGGGSAVSPKVTTFTFTAPKTPGAFQWWCAMPCDPWSMKHNGYMRGIVSVKA